MATRAGTELRRAGVDDRPDVATTFGLAFQDDPVMTWWIGDEADRARILPGFFALTLSLHGERDEAWAVADGSAAAAWMAPGSWHPTGPDELAEIGPKFFEVIGERYFERGSTILGLVEAVHPEEPHWYLQVLGTLPERQGQGLGSALLADMTARIDAEGLSAYLESSNERNLPLYRRYGFEVTGEIALPDGPIIWPMWRDARDAKEA